MLAVIASLVCATAALAQMPTSPWKKGAPFPEPDEELYGVALNGKMYVIGGWDDGKAGGVNYEYNPATDKWTKKQPMPRPAHHAALAAANGKIYVMGGFLPPKDSAIPVGGQTRLDIPNDHLSYAITWFLIALALAGVYLAYHWENGRLTVAGHTKGKT